MNKTNVYKITLFLGLFAVCSLDLTDAHSAPPVKRSATGFPQSPDNPPPRPPPPPPAPPPKNADDAVITTISTMKDRVEEYYKDHHAWPSSLHQIDLADHNEDLNVMMQSETLGPDGVITATFRSDVREVGGKSLLISPVAQSDGTFTWKCSAKDLSLSEFPETCGH